MESNMKKKKDCKQIGIIGIGKLGLCFGLNLSRAGIRDSEGDLNFFDITGVDVSKDYVEAIEKRTFRSEEPGVNDMIADQRVMKSFHATTHMRDISDCEIVFVLVATPSLPDGKYDHSQVEVAVSELMKFATHEYAGKRKNLVIGCTVMPGYCDELQAKVQPYGYDVSYNPEFIAQGSIVRDQQYPDMVLIGEANQSAGDKIQGILATLAKNSPKFARMNRKEAEITKIALNCFLTTKIAFANLVGDVAIASKVRPEVILDAIGSDSRIGSKYLGYGFGFGGPCFPRDNRAFGIYAESVEVSPTIPDATDRSNKEHLLQQVNHFVKTVPKEVKVTFDYITYKKDSVLTVESQQLAFAHALAEKGYTVVVYERSSVIEQLEQIIVPGSGTQKYGKIHFIERES
jgi:nucleotide sugar dehydrogenase